MGTAVSSVVCLLQYKGSWTEAVHLYSRRWASNCRWMMIVIVIWCVSLIVTVCLASHRPCSTAFSCLSTYGLMITNREMNTPPMFQTGACSALSFTCIF